MIKAEVELFCFRNPEIAKRIGEKMFFGEKDKGELTKGVPEDKKKKVGEILEWASKNTEAYNMKVFSEIYEVIK